MAVTLHASVVVGGRVEHVSLDYPPEDVTTVLALLEKADREDVGEAFFTELVSERHDGLVTVLLNGIRLDLPAELSRELADGDELNFLTPIVGG